MKLEVGMYIRTDKGFIAKIKEFKHHYTKGKRLVDGYSVKEVVENYLSLDGNQCRLIESIDYSIPPCYPSDEELDEIKSHIVKTSYNIIDILEVGDYVNGKKVYSLGLTIGILNTINFEDGTFTIAENIKSVVTKELFEIAEYRIGE
jgi:hypothetical protein